MGVEKIIPAGSPALLITYELQRPTKEFDRHQAMIRKHLVETWGDGARKVCGATTWLVPLGEPPQTVHAHLTDPALDLFDEADRLLVMDLAGPDFAPRTGSEALPWLPDWLSDKERQARLVIHHRGQPPIYRYLSARGGTISPTAAAWLVPTVQSADDLFSELTTPGADGTAIVSPDDTLTVATCGQLVHQGFDAPTGPLLHVSYQRHRPRPGLASRLAAKDDWWHNMANTWIVSDPRPADELLNELEPSVADVDQLLVVDFWSPDVAYRPPAIS
jgi:hypothetical protein